MRNPCRLKGLKKLIERNKNWKFIPTPEEAQKLSLDGTTEVFLYEISKEERNLDPFKREELVVKYENLIKLLANR